MPSRAASRWRDPQNQTLSLSPLPYQYETAAMKGTDSSVRRAPGPIAQEGITAVDYAVANTFWYIGVRQSACLSVLPRTTRR